MAQSRPSLSISNLSISPTPESEGATPQNEFQTALEGLILSTDSLIDGMPSTVGLLDSGARVARRKFVDYIMPFVTHTVETDVQDDEVKQAEGQNISVLGSIKTSKKMTFELPSEKTWKLEQLRTRVARREHAFRVVSESFLVSLIGQFDTFIASLAKAVLNSRPEILNGSDRVLTFAQLQGFASMEVAREYLIEKEVDQLLRGSHADQVEWFEKRVGKSKKPLPDRLLGWPAFVEATERRNVIVHADARISNQYLQVCQSVKINLPVSATIGSRLNVDIPYYRTAYEATVEIGLHLGLMVWLNFRPDDGEGALVWLNNKILAYLSESKLSLPPENVSLSELL